MTVSAALFQAEATLIGAGIEMARWDAETLLRHVLGCSRARLIIEGQEALPREAEARFLRLVAERAKRKPLQHLTGIQSFWRHDFFVSPEALIPRSETELAVEATLAIVQDVPQPVIVDVGTGSGCIALSLALERPDAVLHATDVSSSALGVAQTNAERLGCAGRVTFHAGDLLSPVAELKGQVDVIVSNPPYVDAKTAATLAPEVREHEPGVALFPPGEPYSVYRRLVPQAVPLLKLHGVLVLELGMGMRDEVGRICEAAGLFVRCVLPDLRGIPRVLLAVRET